MGAVCRKSFQSQPQCSTIQLSGLHGFEGMKFTFTVDKISRVNTDCLILFTDKKLKVQKNPFLLKCSKSCANKIQEYLDVYLIKEKLLPGQCAIFQILVEELSFRKVCVICLQVWVGRSISQITNPLLDCLQKCLRKLKTNKIQSITIVQYNSQFGLPTRVSHKALMNAIYHQKTGLNDITFLSNNHQQMVQIKKFICDYSHHILDGRMSQSSKQDSVYY